MSGNKIAVDTNTLIYLFNGNEAVAEILDGKKLFISFITEIELLSKPGLTSSQLNILKRLMNDFAIIDINKTIKEEAAQIRREHKLKLPDAIIAATVKYLSITLVTSDLEFGKLSGIDLLLIRN